MSKFSQKCHRSVGEVSSKYGYDRTGEQFEADIQRHIEDHIGVIQFSEFEFRVFIAVADTGDHAGSCTESDELQNSDGRKNH